MRIITAEERMAENVYSKGLIIGRPGSGKTHLLKTLDPKKTLFIDLEAGDLTVKDWEGEYTMRPKTWQDMRDLAVLFGGPNEAELSRFLYANEDYVPYSPEHYARVVEKFGDVALKMVKDVDTLFIDSMSDASTLCKRYTDAHPQSITEKTKKFNGLASYGFLKQEMIALVETFQKTRDKNVWMLANLVEKTDDFGKVEVSVGVDGSFSQKIPYMPDHVFVLLKHTDAEGVESRRLVCRPVDGLPDFLKNRGGALATYEEADLGYLSEKIKQTLTKQ